MSDQPGNAYPNPDNYPEPSFPREVPAPTTDPDQGDQITVRFGLDWLPVLLAAVDQLVLYSTWEGDNNAKLLASMRAETLKALLYKDVTYMVRFNALTCNLEESNDGGDTWTVVDGWALGFPVCVAEAVADIYVDQAGDTMTGELIHDLPSGDTVQSFQADSVEILRNDVLATRFRQRYATGIRWEIYPQNDTSAAYYAYAASRMYMRENLTGLTDLAAFLSLSANNSNSALGIRQSGDGRLMDAWDASLVRMAVENDGGLLALALKGQDYTTASIWRQQFVLEGFWTDDTDATRQGGMALSITDYGGDDEVLAARYDSGAPEGYKAIFFGGVGSSPQEQALTKTDLFQRLVEHLDKYNLVDADLYAPLVQSAPDALTSWECCNAGHYIADQMAAVIIDTYAGIDSSATFQDLYDIMSSFPFNISPATISTLLGLLFGVFSDASTITSDLADVNDLGDDICAANFDLDTIVSGLSGYGWDSATESLIESALTAVWAQPDVLQSMIDLGKYIESAACAAEDFGCIDLDIDFRWSGAQGATLTYGEIEFSTGVKEEYTGTDYRLFIDLDFGHDLDCHVQRIEVTGYADHDAGKDVRVLLGSWDTDHYDYSSPFPAHVTTGLFTFVLDFAPGYQTCDRVRVNRETDTTPYPGDRIYTVKVILT